MRIAFPDTGETQKLAVVCNQGDGQLFSNVESAVKRGLPEVEAYDPVKMPAVIVGGGPSLNSTLESIRHMKECGARIFALNNSAKFLTENGIRPDVQVIIDSRPGNVAFVQERWAGEVLLASQCHPDLFDQCEKIGYPVRLWHPIIDGIEKYITRKDPCLIGGGLTVGLSGMCLIFTLGHREIHLFGYDSCHAEDKGHAYPQPMNASDEITEVAVEGRVFKCSVTMAAQALSFQRIAEMLAELDALVYVHGDGLIPHIAKSMNKEQKVLAAVYDLGVSPPTYDFLGFLAEAEKARIEGGFTDIDVIFQPGPMGGFRHDNLPPSLEERAGMLHRICVSACRLLPSVRNVSILKNRQDVKGDIFPKDYTNEEPVNHYGTRYLKNALPCLKATAGARATIKKRYPRPYATISLRNSPQWPTRNSNEKTWQEVSWELARRGIQTVWLHDPIDPRAEHQACDVDLRLALYEGAVMNFGVSSGPTSLLYCTNAPYMIFKMVATGAPTASAEFLKAQGLEEGEQMSENGQVFWCDDDKGPVLEALQKWLDQPEKIAV